MNYKRMSIERLSKDYQAVSKDYLETAGETIFDPGTRFNITNRYNGGLVLVKADKSKQHGLGRCITGVPFESVNIVRRTE